MRQMARKRQQTQTESDAQTVAAETLIEGRLAGQGLADRLRAISPVTAGLTVAVVVAMGLSGWPYLAAFVYPEPDDPWKTAIEQQLSDVRTGLGAVTEQQADLSRQLGTLQARLGELDGKMAEVVLSVTQSVDTVNAAIDRFDQQMALIDEKLAEQSGAASAQQTSLSRGADNDSLSESASAGAPSAALPGTDDSRFFPELSLPEMSGWWQSLSGWLGGLISVDRIGSEQDR